MTLKQLKAILFHKQSFLLFPIIILLWYSADALYSFGISREDLISHKGTINTINVSNNEDLRKTDRKSEKYLIKFGIDTEPHKLFELISFTSPRQYQVIKSNLKVGDKVTILTEPQLFEKLMKRKSSDTIIRLKKNDKYIIDFFDIANEVYATILLICIPLLIIFSILYFALVRRRYINELQ